MGKEEGEQAKGQDWDALSGHMHTGSFLGIYFMAGWITRLQINHLLSNQIFQHKISYTIISTILINGLYANSQITAASGLS